jgi:hypothetical protein
VEMSLLRLHSKGFRDVFTLRLAYMSIGVGIQKLPTLSTADSLGD